MMLDFDKMLKFVKKELEDNNAIKPKNKNHQFRNRYKHSYRVYLWVGRLALDFDNIKLDVLKTAAIFHDVGYAYQKQMHAYFSNIIFKKYVEQNKEDFTDEFVADVSYLILNHSSKEMIKKTENIELILLMEADLLDEEGAMGILWDLLAKGHKGVEDYEDALEEIYAHSIHILDQDYMVTPLAKKYWNMKKEIIDKFVKAIKSDLFMEE